MKKRKIIGIVTGIFILAFLLLIGFMLWLAHSWQDNHKFEQYVLSEGPWGSAQTWKSEDQDSYLVGKKDSSGDHITLYGYFKTGDNWEKYELACKGRLIYLHPLPLNSEFNEHTVSGYNGRMEFDGKTFIVKELHTKKEDLHIDIKEYRYTVTDKEFNPN